MRTLENTCCWKGGWWETATLSSISQFQYQHSPLSPIRNIQCKVPPFNIPPDLYSIRKIQSSFLDQTNLILLSYSKDNIYPLTFSTISQLQYHHSIPANLLLNQTNSMPISYSKDISISIFSQYQDLIRHSLSPKSDKFNTKPLLSCIPKAPHCFYLSICVCMRVYFSISKYSVRYLVCRILLLHYLEK